MNDREKKEKEMAISIYAFLQKNNYSVDEGIGFIVSLLGTLCASENISQTTFNEICHIMKMIYKSRKNMDVK